MIAIVFLLLFFAGKAFAVESLPPLPPDMPLPAAVVKAVSSAAVPLMALPKSSGARIDLRFVPVAQVVDLIYADLLQEPYVLDPEVLADTRPVSFRFDKAQGDVRDFLGAFLGSLGYEVHRRDGVYYVSKSKDAPDEVDKQTFVYTPKYRHADYLSRLVQPLVKGHFTENKAVAAPEGAKSADDVPATSAAGQLDQSTDVMVFLGSAKEVQILNQVLPQLDTPVGEVVIRGWAYEVDDTKSANSGFSIAADYFGAKLSVGSGSTSTDSNAFQISAGSLTAAISALNADSRFKEVSSPNVRCISGQDVRLNVGQQVPTVSSVSYQGTSGTPVQSIDYQDAGVIFDVQPLVMQDAIELKVDEEISSFVSTTTGVSGSPTKNTRSLKTVASLKDGDVIVLGGLMQDDDTAANSREGFLPWFLAGHTKSKARTEVVLVLQVQKI